MNHSHVAAIVPAFNEADNIARVLDVLTKTDILTEVIVVDDGSADETAEVVGQYQKVKLLINEKNEGKAYGMQRGVDETTADFLFFCDADLRDLTPEIVTDIIKPVIDGEYDMFVGVRNNMMQKAVKLFALNSGERAMTREIWEEVPEEYKYRFRIEAGINHVANLKGNTWGWEKFDYYQTLKEKKYGLIKGTKRRWKMNADVGLAYGLNALDKTQEVKEKAVEKTQEAREKALEKGQEIKNIAQEKTQEVKEKTLEKKQEVVKKVETIKKKVLKKQK